MGIDEGKIDQCDEIKQKWSFRLIILTETNVSTTKGMNRFSFRLPRHLYRSLWTINTLPIVHKYKRSRMLIRNSTHSSNHSIIHCDHNWRIDFEIVISYLTDRWNLACRCPGCGLSTMIHCAGLRRERGWNHTSPGRLSAHRQALWPVNTFESDPVPWGCDLRLNKEWYLASIMLEVHLLDVTWLDTESSPRSVELRYNYR
jgi:hypothetical protein